MHDFLLVFIPFVEYGLEIEELCDQTEEIEQNVNLKVVFQVFWLFATISFTTDKRKLEHKIGQIDVQE